MNDLDKKLKKELDREDARFITLYKKAVSDFFKRVKSIKGKEFFEINKELIMQEHQLKRKLYKLFREHGYNCFNMGRLHGKYEIIAEGHETHDFKKLEPMKLSEPLPFNEDGFFWIVPKNAMEAIDKRQLVLSGNVTKDMLDSIKGYLREKIQGADELVVENNIAKTLNSTLERGELISITESTYYYNKGRVATFLEDGVEYIQFSSIMDGRTSPQCTSRHGLVMRTDSAELAMNTPPLHGRCRSILKPYFDKPSEKMMDWSGVAELPNGWKRV